jgi:hypothetical protein
VTVAPSVQPAQWWDFKINPVINSVLMLVEFLYQVHNSSLSQYALQQIWKEPSCPARSSCKSQAQFPTNQPLLFVSIYRAISSTFPKIMVPLGTEYLFIVLKSMGIWRMNPPLVNNGVFPVRRGTAPDGSSELLA